MGLSAVVASQFDKYFYDPGPLGYIVASDYRQLLRGAFPFLESVGRDSNVRPDIERYMSVDAKHSWKEGSSNLKR